MKPGFQSRREHGEAAQALLYWFESQQMRASEALEVMAIVYAGMIYGFCKESKGKLSHKNAVEGLKQRVMQLIQELDERD